MQAKGGANPLADRLRELRVVGRMTQRDLADALGAHRKVGISSISSWENGSALPPVAWLEIYATVFPGGDELKAELVNLRAAAATATGAAGPDRLDDKGPWAFTDSDDAQITIVCAQLPRAMRDKMPYTNPDDPDYVELYTFADPDALVELFGHLRAVNPRAEVRFRTAATLEPEDFPSHLVLLGGVDWNSLTRRVMNAVALPVTHRWVDGVGQFEVREGDEVKTFETVVEDGRLVEDVAHFFRGPNPFDKQRTVTICNGMYSRGTYGAVRTLTHKDYRERNAEHVHKYQPGVSYSILARVPIVGGTVITPDWNDPDTLLHEWSSANG